VFAGGAAVVTACLDALDIEHAIVTDYALREGLLYNLLGQILHEDPREGTVTGLLDKYHVDRAQADRVTAVAMDLYDQIADQWQPSPATRDWLNWSAQLHELGLTIGHHGYHRHGAYLLASSDLPGFTKLEQNIIATLVGNHRRLPDPTSFDELLVRLRPVTQQLLALLRLAVLLCRTRSGEPPKVHLRVDDNCWRVRFPDGWLDANPLTRANLRDERALLEPLHIQLEVSD